MLCSYAESGAVYIISECRITAVVITVFQSLFYYMESS